MRIFIYFIILLKGFSVHKMCFPFSSWHDYSTLTLFFRVFYSFILKAFLAKKKNTFPMNKPFPWKFLCTDWPFSHAAQVYHVSLVTQRDVLLAQLNPKNAVLFHLWFARKPMSSANLAQNIQPLNR